MKSGAQTSIQLAVGPDLEYVTEKYFAACKAAQEADVAEDHESAKWLWNISEEWTGLNS